MIDPRVNIREINSYIYGEEWSELWQKYFSVRPTTQDTVDFLTEVSGDSGALELGIGSGRIAVPLSQNGVEVHGIDTSESMLKYLKENDKEDRIKHYVADAESFDLEKKDFSLIYFVSWGLQMLLGEESKAKCFECVSRHLAPGGVFVIETMHFEGYTFGEADLKVQKIDRGSVILSGELHYPQDKILLNSYVFLEDNKTPRVHTSASHYLSTDELDSLANNVGLSLESEFGYWNGCDLTGQSPSMIRVYRKK